MRHTNTKTRRGIVAAFAQPRSDGLSGEQLIVRLSTEFPKFMDRQRDEMASLRSDVDGLNLRLAAVGLDERSLAAGGRQDDPEYSTAFAGWFRSGDGEADLGRANATGQRSLVHASMSGTSNGAGGYLAPTEWDRQMRKSLEALSPMRRIARVVPTTVRAYSTLYRGSGWQSGWVSETAARPNTNTPNLLSLHFPNGEIYANPAVTQQLLDDADFRIEQWLADEVSEEFSKQESVAFLSGDGTDKPRGLLTYVTGGASDGHHPGGNLTVVPTGSATGLAPASSPTDKFIDFVYGLPAPYRQGATWLMNSITASIIAKYKDGNGNYIWRASLAMGQPDTLLGYPVEIDEGMPDVAAGALPVAFGDFKRGYVINDRAGVRVLRDPYTNKPYVNFYTTKRVGGGVDDTKAIRLLKVSA